jgi:hypothetical protein
MDTKHFPAVRITDRYGRWTARGRDENGNWVIGAYSSLFKYISHENEKGELKFTEVDPNTVGQRLKVSSFGEEDRYVFEGDVVDHGSVVSFVSRETTTTGEATGMQIGWYTQRDNFESWSLITIGEEFTVHGNIHDDPELPKKIKNMR